MGGNDGRGEAEASGALYRLAVDGAVTQSRAGYVITNGPAFSTSGDTMFTPTASVAPCCAFDVDALGNVANKRVFVAFDDPIGRSDRMTIGAEGQCWCAASAALGFPDCISN
ncbi:MAG: SMP-30/gluconolactonase/LRE family protein [Acidimicrobiales bacterium]